MKKFSLFGKAEISLLVTATFILSVVAALFGQAARQSNGGTWTAIEESSLDQSAKRLIVPLIYQTMRLDQAALAQTLASAPMEFTRDASQNPIIYLPMPDGTLARFRFEESPIIEPGLAAKYPELKMTYRAQGVDDPAATSRFDWLPTGFHAIILSPAGTVLIDPYAEGNTTDYITYWKKDAANLKHPFVCEFVDPELPPLPDANGGPAPAVTSGTTLRTYRLALAATNEYCVAVGGNTVAGSLAAEVLVMNRVNGVYERDLAIRMVMVANNNLITYAGNNTSCSGGSCNSGNDPYDNGNGPTMLGQNQTTCDTVIGSANYDIGHVFSTGGGGVATLNGPCGSNKARGVTGQSVPLGDPFAIDYVAHEMGHQWGANHTFNGASGNCGDNRHGPAAYETGSGITIMAYAGICGAQNLAANSIDTFHVKSLEEIVAYSQSGNGNTCDVETATGNTAPSVSGPGTFTIPQDTPFSLTASASDPNGDSITYDWQEYDLGAATTDVPNTDAGGAMPIFRPYLPTAVGTRTFPSLQFILANANVPSPTTGAFLTGELLPTISRAMVFQVVARDNRANGGGINTATSTVTVVGTAGVGPFAVTAPNTAVSWPGFSLQTVTWNVTGTTANGINTASVKISLSTDGGNTFATTLLASTPNDGTQSVTIPNTPTTTARIKVEAVGNIFFDISDTNFTITASATPTPTPTPSPAPTPTPSPTPTPTPSPTPVAITVSLPIDTMDTSVPIGTNIVKPVLTTNISASSNFVAFQGDFVFDETVCTFQTPFVLAAGLTADEDNPWTVTANILAGGGPTSRILRVFGSANDGNTPLSGSGTLYNLRMRRVSSTPGANTPLAWRPAPNNFVFIDTGLATQAPTQTNGLITITQGAVDLSGTVTYCSNPLLNPVAGVTMTLTGTSGDVQVTDGSGNYTFTGLTSGGNYTVTPTKAALAPAANGIDGVDVLAVQRHFLSLGTPLSGCRLTAADVSGDTFVNGVDALAVQRFFLGFPTGIANTGQYQFNPANRAYSPLTSSQSGQNYDALILGDVAAGFIHRSETGQDAAGDTNEVASTVAAIALPDLAIQRSGTNFTAAVTTTAIDEKTKLVGFQGDFTFDERLVTFESEPVRKAGLTAGNWNVAGNVLPGPGPMRTLRVLAYSLDFTPLSGIGTLFELRMSRVDPAAQSKPLLWVAPSKHFLFIDADLHTQRPGTFLQK